MENYVRAYTESVLALLEPNPEAIVLDLGCGNGKLSAKIVSKVGAKRSFGIDCQPQDCKIPLLAMNLEKPIRLHDESFDVVTAANILEHIGDTDNLLSEIRRVLKPNGYAIISTPNLAAFTTIAFLLIGRQPTMVSATDWRNGKKNSFHRRVFTYTGLKKALWVNGLSIEKEIATCYYPLPTFLSHIAANIDKRHAACITVKVRKDKLHQ